MKERGQGQTNAAEWGRGDEGGGGYYSLQFKKRKAVKINQTYYF